MVSLSFLRQHLGYNEVVDSHSLSFHSLFNFLNSNIFSRSLSSLLNDIFLFSHFSRFRPCSHRSLCSFLTVQFCSPLFVKNLIVFSHHRLLFLGFKGSFLFFRCVSYHPSVSITSVNSQPTYHSFHLDLSEQVHEKNFPLLDQKNIAHSSTSFCPVQRDQIVFSNDQPCFKHAMSFQQRCFSFRITVLSLAFGGLGIAMR